MSITQFIPLIPGFDQAWKAYKAPAFKLPVVGKSFHVLDKNSPEFLMTQLKTALTPFFLKIGIKKDIKIIEEPNEHLCCALGTNFGKGDAVIALSPGFYKVDPQACSWVCKHEASHIKNNDLFMIPLITSICSIATAIFLLANQPKNSQSSITLMFFKILAIQSAAYTLVSQYAERRADTLANENSDLNELEGGLKFLTANITANQNKRTNTWMNFLYTPEGECRLDLLHPSFESRIEKIQKRYAFLKGERYQIDKFQTYLLKDHITSATEELKKARQANEKSFYKLGPFTITRS